MQILIYIYLCHKHQFKVPLVQDTVISFYAKRIKMLPIKLTQSVLSPCIFYFNLFELVLLDLFGHQSSAHMKNISEVNWVRDL